MKQPKITKAFFKKPAVVVAMVIGLAVLAGVAYGGYLFAVSPPQIRNPELEHYHFRMQVLVDGEAENLGSPAYQTPYTKDLCNAELPDQPIHFHDNKDQFVHIHWGEMTGGIVLKNYGWNFIGGPDDTLGYRLDDPMNIKKVPIHSNSLPGTPDRSDIYVYTGDENGYQKKEFNDFVNQDLESFFGTTSNFPAQGMNQQKANPLSFLSMTAHAQASESHEHGTSAEATEEELTKTNNLLGNVIIFVQDEEPTDEAIKARFIKLEPLSESTCGG